MSNLIEYKSSINLCFCIDVNLLHFLKNVINSILRINSKHSLTIHIIIDESVSLRYIKKLYTKRLFPFIEFKFYKLSWKNPYNGIKHITKTTMLRLYIPTLLSNTELVIYLDVDIIVNCNLQDIIDKHDVSNIGIAIKDSLVINHFIYIDNTAKEQQSGNCGVMLLNCKILRENNFVETCLQLCEKYPKYHDQEIINMFCKGNHCKLSQNYNIFHNQDNGIIKKYSNDFIYHFAGSKKPYYDNVGEYQFIWDRNNFIDKRINLGVLNYYNADLKKASGNIGDYIQTLATLNYYKKYIEKHDNMKFENFETFLKVVLNNTHPNYNFVFIERDNLNNFKNHYGYDNIIIVLNGWWLHQQFNKLLFNVPSNMKPLFISFHIYEKQILEKPFIDVLRKHEPIGCRDYSTMELLKSNNVKCYFSGCLTIGIDIYKWSENNSQNSYLVDVIDKKKHNLKLINHDSNSYKNICYKEGLKIALDYLKMYSESKFVKTSKLHCYLPCMAMDVPVQLVSPRNEKKLANWGAGKRFIGLVDIINSDNKQNYISMQKNTIFNFIDKYSLK